MIKICGFNKFSQFGENKNSKITEEGACISPPGELHIDITQLSSISAYSQHTVWITQDYIGHALGNNHEGRISGTIPLENFKHAKEFYLQDSQGLPISIFSAVCGNFYTLYLVKRQDGYHLGFVHRSQNDGIPLFLNLNGHQPVTLYGGWETAAAIDEEGSIAVITESIFDDPSKPVDIHHLPHNEKAISVACCSKFILALSSIGRVFIASLSWDKKLSHFEEVHELSSKNIVDISGTYNHFLAVTKEGQVYGHGENQFGKLGIGKEIENEDKFVEIASLKSEKIAHAYAGYDHSLFQTEDGKVLACGKNNFGQLFLESGPSDDCVYLPIETSIKKGAKFCIAGNGLSVAFVNSDPPPNTPNKKITKA